MSTVPDAIDAVQSALGFDIPSVAERDTPVEPCDLATEDLVATPPITLASQLADIAARRVVQPGDASMVAWLVLRDAVAIVQKHGCTNWREYLRATEEIQRAALTKMFDTGYDQGRKVGSYDERTYGMASNLKTA
jgi:hypothetical protein